LDILKGYQPVRNMSRVTPRLATTGSFTASRIPVVADELAQFLRKGLDKEGGYAPYYTPMAVSETESGFIVGADVLMGNVEHLVMTAMVDTVECGYGEKPQAVLGDSVYSTGQNLAAMEDRQQEWLWGCTAFNLRKLMGLWGALRAKLNAEAAVAIS